jgi:hypothetical protein
VEGNLRLPTLSLGNEVLEKPSFRLSFGAAPLKAVKSSKYRLQLNDIYDTRRHRSTATALLNPFLVPNPVLKGLSTHSDPKSPCNNMPGQTKTRIVTSL